ncbi:hypothetical protein [Nocardia sp. NPDC002869]|uniref:hypothetical protein n=1 Tax=Nocardia sp. NPDC002869 TaxID=3161032 RepID=UPI00398C9A80
MIASEAAAGLFRRAIVQSGNGFGAFAPAQGARVTRHSTRTLPSARYAPRLSAMRCSVRAVAGLP